MPVNQELETSVFSQEPQQNHEQDPYREKIAEYINQVVAYEYAQVLDEAESL